MIRSKPGATGAPQLIYRDPIQAAINAIAKRLEAVVDDAPGSDAARVMARDLELLTAAVQQAEQFDVWVATRDAARLRGCSQSAVTKAARTGRLVAQKRGGVWFIHRDSVLASLDKAA